MKWELWADGSTGVCPFSETPAMQGKGGRGCCLAHRGQSPAGSSELGQWSDFNKRSLLPHVCFWLKAVGP